MWTNCTVSKTSSSSTNLVPCLMFYGTAVILASKKCWTHSLKIYDHRALTKSHARGCPTTLLTIKTMVEVASCFRIMSGSRVYSRYLKCTSRTASKSVHLSVMASYMLSVSLDYITGFSKLYVSRPVEQPWLLGAGEGRAEFVSFNSNGGVFKFWPSKLPFFSTTCCDGVTVYSGTQVGVDPEKRWSTYDGVMAVQCSKD